MSAQRITWAQFKGLASQDLLANGAFVYRGQRDAAWTLKTTLHRTDIVRTIGEMKGYADVVLPRVHDALEGWLGRKWDRSDPLGLAEFLAFVQHNGFPTPLLDWTFSPYIAAYFAYESVNHFSPQSEYVAIYRFEQRKWAQSYQQVLDFGQLVPHVSVLRPRIVGNHKLAVQQGLFTFTTVPDIEGHIRLNEATGNISVLTKYELATSERPHVMTELALMGISAIQLMPSPEAVCKKALEDLIGLNPMTALPATQQAGAIFGTPTAIQTAPPPVKKPGHPAGPKVAARTAIKTHTTGARRGA